MGGCHILKQSFAFIGIVFVQVDDAGGILAQIGQFCPSFFSVDREERNL